MSHSNIDYIKDQRKMKGRYGGCFSKQSDLRLSYANQQRWFRLVKGLVGLRSASGVVFGHGDGGLGW